MRSPLIFGLVALVLVGLEGCLLFDDTACDDDSDCESGQTCSDGECVDGEGGPADGPSGGGPSKQPAECTAETEIARIQKFATGVAVPAECKTDLLDGDYSGEIAPHDGAYKTAGRNVVVAKIDGLTLT